MENTTARSVGANRCAQILAVVAVLGSLQGCGVGGGPWVVPGRSVKDSVHGVPGELRAQATSPPGAPEPNPAEVVRVTSAAELLGAIGSNRTILLGSGVYNLSTAHRFSTRFVTWQEVFDGWELVIQNVYNLSIRGPKRNRAEILVVPRYGWVLRFADVKNVTLSNLTIGHTQPGYCEGGVLDIQNSEEITLDNCDLFGSGTEGMRLSSVKGLTFRRSRIRDCTYGIMTIEGSRDLKFEQSRFQDNEEFWGIVVRGSAPVKFKDCLVLRNKTETPLFDVDDDSEVDVKNSAVEDNSSSRLSGPWYRVRFSSTVVRQNRWHEEKIARRNDK